MDTNFFGGDTGLPTTSTTLACHLSLLRCPPLALFPSNTVEIQETVAPQTLHVSFLPNLFSRLPGCRAGNAALSVSFWDGKLLSMAPPVSETFQASLSIWAFSSVCLLFIQAPNHRMLWGKHSFIYSANAGRGIPGPPSPRKASAKQRHTGGLSSHTLRFSERVCFS